jgi:hypothetical protein
MNLFSKIFLPSVAILSLSIAATPAQTTNRANLLLRSAAIRSTVPLSVVTKPINGAATGPSSVTIKLPKDVSRYHVLEQQSKVNRTATNLDIVSHNEVRASVAPGSTLVFLEKDPPPRVVSTNAAQEKAMFSTLLIKSDPARPGEPQRSGSGTLTLLADVPVPWDGVSNRYVAHLSVVFLTDDPTNNPLLPMTVELEGHNVRLVEPRRVELERGNPAKDVLVLCDQYNPNVQITAYYQLTNTTRELTLQPLTLSGMTQMIISEPMLFAAFTGGLMGGFLRLFKKSKWEAKRMTHYLTEGSLVGVVTVTMLLAGLLHSQIAGLSTQPQLVLAFSLAAAAGSVGAHFLDQVIGQLRGKKTR